MLPKNKVMLQIPVDKSIATAWQNIVKVSGIKQGDVFTMILADFLNNSRQSAKLKGGEQDGKSEVKN